MKLLGWLVCIVLFLVLLSACENTAPLPDPEVESTPVVTSQPVSLLSKLQRISFGQENYQGGYAFAEWQAPDLPNEPTRMVYHLDDVNMHIEFRSLSQEERKSIIDSIRVDGNVDWEIVDRSNHTHLIHLRFKKTKEAYILHFGDLPPITFERKEPLTYTYTPIPGKDTPHLLLHAREYSTRLMIPEDESTVTLTFSEEMHKEKLPLTYEDKPVEVEWISSTQLVIPLKNMYPVSGRVNELILHLYALKALSGNYLDMGNSALQIQQSSPYEWYESKSGNSVGSSPRDRFYDQMIFSQNKQSYVGVVTLGGSMGDGDGTSYSYVLEQKGHEPIVIEDVFYSTIEPSGQPIQWKNDTTLLYSSYYGVYAYDIEKGEKRTLHDNGSDERNNINYAVYDPTGMLLHILAYENRNDGKNQLELFSYDRGGETPVTTKNFTSTVSVAKYSALDMNITPTPKGTYWTRIQEGVPVTEFINNTGKRFTAKGIVRVALKQGAYLQQYTKGEHQLESPKWVYWKPGHPAVPIAKIPEYNDMFISGSELIYVLDSKYYKYDAQLDKWVAWKAANGEVNAEPIKGTDGLYRVWEGQ